jgi:hypothetical protein
MTVYRVIPLENNKISQYRNAREVSVFFMGRRISAYIVIKTDTTGSRVVPLEGLNLPDVQYIQQMLETA